MLIVVHFTYDKHLVSIPDTTKYTPKELQNLFDQWLFDENIDHECWVYTNGKKDYVAYDVDDFIKWLNENIFNNFVEKVRLEEKNISKIPPNTEIIYF